MAVSAWLDALAPEQKTHSACTHTTNTIFPPHLFGPSLDLLSPSSPHPQPSGFCRFRRHARRPARPHLAPAAARHTLRQEAAQGVQHALRM